MRTLTFVYGRRRTLTLLCMAWSRQFFTACVRGRLGFQSCAIPRLPVPSISGIERFLSSSSSSTNHDLPKLSDCELGVPFASRLRLCRPALCLKESVRSFSADETAHQSKEESVADDVVKLTGEPISDALPLTVDAIQEAAEIGYKVVGRVKPEEFGRIKPPKAFAVVQVGSHQFKISPGDCIYTEKLKYADVNDKLCLEKVLLLGSRSQTIIGRPVVPKAFVHAVVEEQALDAKVIIFKKKRRKNYRRTNGHRQELTRLRILDIRGLGQARSAIA